MKSTKNKKTIRKPSKVYKQCPYCKSKNLISLEVDVLCGSCDWMSCEEYVQSGGMDDLIGAFFDHFTIDSEVETMEFQATSLSEKPLENQSLIEIEASA